MPASPPPQRAFLAALLALLALFCASLTAQAHAQTELPIAPEDPSIVETVLTRATGFSNGRLPASAVSPINTGIKCDGLRGQLPNRAAAGWNTASLFAGKPLPINGCASAYRPIGSPGDCRRGTYGTQWYFWECLPRGQAAYPGTSNHGAPPGAVDVPQWVRTWIDNHGRQFGFDKSCSDAAHEWWHVKFCAGFSRPNPGLRLHHPILRSGSGGPGQAPFVKEVQRRLNAHGLKTRVDGSYGPNTRKLVARLQARSDIKRTGVVTKATWKALRAKPAPTTVEVLRRYDVKRPTLVIAEARRAKLALRYGLAMLEKETGIPMRNIFGCDYGPRSTPPWCHQAVTDARVDALRSSGLMNGVGVTQITWHTYVTRAERLGGAHKPKYQMRVGFDVLAGNIRAKGAQQGAAAYNGSGPAAQAYGRDFMDKQAKWGDRLAEAR